jgi:hypothetical protein
MSKKFLLAMAFVPFLCAAKDDGLTEFNFCGIPDMFCAISNLSVQVGCAELPEECQEFLTEVAQRQALGFSLAFQACLSTAELRACAGDRKSYCSCMDMVGNLLRFLLKNDHIVGKSIFGSNFARTEMSLARVINGKFGKEIAVSANDIRRWLPEFEAKGSRNRVNLARFKKLLVIGAAIEQYRREHNTIPDNLQTLVGEKNLGISESDLSLEDLRVEYKVAQEFWKMRLGSFERAVPEPIYDFIPAVFPVAGIVVDEIWFASTYTQKRKELFENGYLPSDDVYCRCRLKGCVVYRGCSVLSSED